MRDPGMSIGQGLELVNRDVGVCLGWATEPDERSRPGGIETPPGRLLPEVRRHGACGAVIDQVTGPAAP